MRRTNTRIVKLEPYQEGNDEATKERNARVYDYTRRNAITTLEHFVIEPFTEAVFEETEQEAARAGDVSIVRTFPNLQVRVKIETKPITRYEAVLAGFKTLLGFWKTGVAGILEGDTAYVEVTKVVEQLARLKQDLTEHKSQKHLDILSANGEKLPPDTDITQLMIYLDAERIKRITEPHARTFHQAKSLSARLNQVRKDYERRVFEQEGIPEQNLEENVETSYELEDGTAVRFLFYKRNVTEHGKIFDGFVNPRNEKITTATGDLLIAIERAFQEPATYKHARTSVEIKTETTERPALGRLHITRQSSGNQHERNYRVLKGHDGLYVAVEDIEANLAVLRERYTTKPTQLKVDFYAAKP